MGNGKKGWWEKQEEVKTENGIEKKAPNHRKVALEKEAGRANNIPMHKRSRKPRGYWTYENTLKELKLAIAEIGHFPTRDELYNLKRGSLSSLLSKYGGVNTFRKLVGVNIAKRPNGYWTYENTLKELKIAIVEIGHFPTQQEFKTMKQDSLLWAINKHGGILKFKKLLGYEPTQKPDGYWTYESTLKELENIVAEIGHFPTEKELSVIKKTSLSYAMNKYGGANKFRELLGYEPTQRPHGYWTFDNTLSELKTVIAKIGHYPTGNELSTMKQTSLSWAMEKHGGSTIFRELLGYGSLKKPDGYWTEETTIDGIKKAIDSIKKFPTKAELYKMGRGDLVRAIDRHGGFPKFRLLLGYEYLKRPNRYWTFDTIIKELKMLITPLGHFPSHNELCMMGMAYLSAAMKTEGGISKFREALGYSNSLHEQHMVKSGSYSSRRGKKTEELVKDILIKWCENHKLPEPKYNKKLAPHNFLEFVCGIGKTIGIDITNTKDKSGNSIRRKYLKKDYYKHVDELWIVVFSNAFEKRDYNRFNNESPSNVKVMSIDDFLKELGVSTEEHLTSRIEAYKKCTFCTKDEFIKRHLNTSLDNYVNNNTGEIK